MSQRSDTRGRGRGGELGGGGGGGRDGGQSRGAGAGSERAPRSAVDGGLPRGGGGFGGGRGRGGPPAIFAAGVPPRVDPRLASAPAAAAANLAAGAYSPDHPLRPGYGTLGTEVILRANFFPVTIPKGPIFEYTVGIEPTMPKELKGRLFQLLDHSVEFKPYVDYIAHDCSARLVAAKKLPQPLNVRITFIEEGRAVALPNAKKYTVSIAAIGELETSGLQKYLLGRLRVFGLRAESIHRYLNADPAARYYDPLPVLSAINLVLRQRAPRGGFQLSKKRYFFTPRERLELSTGVQAWQGFVLSVQPVFKQLMVNVNVCMSAFYEPANLADVLHAFQRNSRGALPARFVKKLTVRTRHLGYKKAVRRIVPTPATKLSFDCAELGGKVTLAQYFEHSLSFLPCVLSQCLTCT
jgi:eukaryotic translation initiation factor 2C